MIVADLLARRLADPARVLEAGTDELIADGAVVDGRLVDGALVHGPALRLVGGEQRRPPQPCSVGGQLPAEIDRVADAHVHAEAAERRMQVAGVAGQEHAALGVAVGDQAARRPRDRCATISIARSARPVPRRISSTGSTRRRVDVARRAWSP